MKDTNREKTCFNETTLEILNRLAEYRDGEEAESRCLQEIHENGAPKSWLILALINLEEKKFQNFGTCLRNATQDGSLDVIIPELADMTEHVSAFLDETYCAIGDFFDGYLGKE